MCYFFNVLESGHESGLDVEPCDEVLTCHLEQMNQIKGCILTPPLAPTREPAAHLGRRSASVTSVLLSLKGCLHK